MSIMEFKMNLRTNLINTSSSNHNQNNYTFPTTGLVRLSDILRVMPIGRTTWWKGVKSGVFPKGIKFASNVTAWRAEDIRKLIASYSNGDDHEANGE
jgi:prophage regulatory protein